MAPVRAPAQRDVPRFVVDASASGAPISRGQFGVNEPFFAPAQPRELVAALRGLGVGLIRWPDGGGDVYHWRSNAVGTGACSRYAGSPQRWAQFDSFMTQVAGPSGADVVLGTNYGSNAACTGGGDPAEAADWVDYANNVKHYGVALWTIGNEQWADFALDLHAAEHDPHAYAANVAQHYYPMMKAKDPSIKIGVDLAVPYNAPPVGCGGCTSARVASWDAIVLKEARYDFVDIHVYAEAAAHDDRRLLVEGPLRVAGAIAATRAELRAAGRPATPIMIGEWNAEGFALGKQTTSVVGALFAGLAGATILESGVEYAAFFDGFEQSCGSNAADAGLYGWLPYGSWSLVSAGSATVTGAGGCTAGMPFPPAGTVYPAGRTLGLLRDFAQPGEHMLRVAPARPAGDVRVFAATREGGYAVLLFNLNRDAPTDATVAIGTSPAAPLDASLTTYGKAEYDLIRGGAWSGAVTASLGTVTSSAVSVRLPAWSMNVLFLRRRPNGT